MYVDNELLKDWYCFERKKLEELPAFMREATLNSIKSRMEIEDVLTRTLKVSEIVTKEYAGEHLKTLLDDRFNENEINGYIGEALKQGHKELAVMWKGNFELDKYGIQNACKDYAEYFYQLEKFSKIEELLNKRKLDPEKVYKECKK